MKLSRETRFKRLLTRLETAQRQKALAEKKIAAINQLLRRYEKRFGEKASAIRQDRSIYNTNKRKREAEQRKILREVRAYTQLIGQDPECVSFLLDRVGRHRGYWVDTFKLIYPQPPVRVPAYIFGRGWVTLIPFLMANRVGQVTQSGWHSVENIDKGSSQ